MKFWIWIAAIVLIGAVIMWADDAKSRDFATSRDGWEDAVTFVTDSDCDSARVRFVIPDTVAPYVTTVETSIKLYPWVQDSTFLRGSGLTLDSTIIYLVSTAYYLQGSATAQYDTSYWYHNGPARPEPSTPSGSYICRVDAYLGDLSSNYVKNATVTAKLDKQVVYDTCADMLVFDRVKKTAPTGVNGYFYFDLIRSYCIGGEKYTLTVAKPGFPDVVRKFTVPDSSTHRLIWSN